MRIAELEVRPAERLITGPHRTVALEPLVMAFFMELAEQAGTVVGRPSLFARLWGSLPVGDDSLNHVAAALRRRLAEAGAASVRVETVPGAGYLLRLIVPAERDGAEQDVAQAIEEAVDSWRLNLPAPDYLRIALLARASALAKGQSRLHGLLALHHRHAAEYGNGGQVSNHVRECEHQARQALAIDAVQAEALTALVSLGPLYGNWRDAYHRLLKICADTNDNPVPAHDLAVLEMATGQVEAATRRRELLSQSDPYAAIFAYKAIYQYWSLDRRTAMDHAADRALQLWPSHPAVWTARFWTLLYSDRAAAAEALTRHPPLGLPAAMVEFLRDVARSMQSGQAGSLVGRARQLAGAGPSQAITALFVLGMIGAVDDSFDVAERYYLQRQAQPVPTRPGPSHPQVNEQNRRLTQILFTPAGAGMRRDRRFAGLTAQIGLDDFWESSEIIPDYRRG